MGRVVRAKAVRENARNKRLFHRNRKEAMKERMERALQAAKAKAEGAAHETAFTAPASFVVSDADEQPPRPEPTQNAATPQPTPSTSGPRTVTPASVVSSQAGTSSGGTTNMSSASIYHPKPYVASPETVCKYGPFAAFAGPKLVRTDNRGGKLIQQVRC